MDKVIDQLNVKSRYPGQADDEVTQRVFYKTFFAVAPIIFASIVVALVSLGVVFYGATNNFSISEVVTLSGAWLSLIGFAGIGLAFLFTVAALWIWRNNRVVVTNEHIVDIDQTTLFNRTVSTLTLNKIQDVRAEVKGPMQTIFSYGTLVIQTAGERENFAFDYLPNPYEAEKYILEIHRKFFVSAENSDGVAEPIVQKNPLES